MASPPQFITREDMERFWAEKLEPSVKMMVESLVNERIDTEVKKSQRRQAAAQARRPALANFGQENYEYLLMPYLTHTLKRNEDLTVTIQRIIKDLYFNAEYKKNHNVYIPRESYNYACIYKDNAWRTYPLDYCIDAIIRRANDVLQHYMIGTDTDVEKMFEKEIGKKKVELLREFTDKIDNLEQFPELQKKLHKDTENTITTFQHTVHAHIFETPSD